MANFLTADGATTIKKDASSFINRIHARPSGRSLGHLTKTDNPNYQPNRSGAERAISKLHSGGNARTAIAKTEPGTDAGAAAIAALHGDRSFASRPVSGNSILVQKLTGAVAEVSKRNFVSAADAKRELRKLIDDAAPIRKRIVTANSNDQPRTHAVVKRGKGKAGESVMTFRKGSDFPYIIEVDGCYHSEHPNAERADAAFARLTA